MLPLSLAEFCRPCRELREADDKFVGHSRGPRDLAQIGAEIHPQSSSGQPRLPAAVVRVPFVAARHEAVSQEGKILLCPRVARGIPPFLARISAAVWPCSWSLHVGFPAEDGGGGFRDVAGLSFR